MNLKSGEVVLSQQKNNQTIGTGEFLLELRNNYSVRKFDWGIQFCVTEMMGDEISNEGISTGKIQETGTYLLPVFDYNFRQGQKISYFIGSGLGMMISRVNNYSSGSLCAMPRIGVEFFHHLRLTLDYKGNPRGEYNYGEINVLFSRKYIPLYSTS